IPGMARLTDPVMLARYKQALAEIGRRAMSITKPRESKDRPFPWLCIDCFTLTVVPTVIDYTTKVKQDGVVHELHLPSIEVPCCQTCGETVITSAVDEQVSNALRAKLHLLTPAQMRKAIETLGLQEQELAE